MRCARSSNCKVAAYYATNETHHMATLLSSRLLVFEVNASRTCLDEELCKLHDSRESTVA